MTNEGVKGSFVDIFGSMEDPRDIRGKKYPLIDVFMLAVYGTLCGFNDFVGISYFLKRNEQKVKEALGINGIPSHDTFSAVFRVINVKKFMECYIEWIRQLLRTTDGHHIAIDGKAIRAARDRINDGKVPYVVSAFMCDIGLSIGQKAVGEKTNEIKEIPALIDLLDIKDNVITIDAIGTNTNIINKIEEKDGKYCLQLKGNNKEIFEEVDYTFKSLTDDEKSNLGSYHTVEKDHGRIEERSYYILTDEKLIKAVIGDKWPSVKCIGMAELTREENKTATKELHYHVLNFIPTPEEYRNYARNHWWIENKLHWVLDVQYNEDRSTARKDNALANLSLLRKIVFNFTKLMPEFEKKSTRQKSIDFMTDISLFRRMMFEVLPKV